MIEFHGGNGGEGEAEAAVYGKGGDGGDVHGNSLSNVTISTTEQNKSTRVMVAGFVLVCVVVCLAVGANEFGLTSSLLGIEAQSIKQQDAP